MPSIWTATRNCTFFGIAEPLQLNPKWACALGWRKNDPFFIESFVWVSTTWLFILARGLYFLNWCWIGDKCINFNSTALLLFLHTVKITWIFILWTYCMSHTDCMIQYFRYLFQCFRCQNRLPFEQGCLGTWNQKRPIQNPCPTSQKEKRGRRLCPKTLHFGYLRPSRFLQGTQDCQRWRHRVNKCSNKRTILCCHVLLFCLCTICIWCLFRCRVNYRIACGWNQLWISSDVSRRIWLRLMWRKWLTLWVHCKVH